MNISQAVIPTVAAALLASSGMANAELSFVPLPSGATATRTEAFNVSGFTDLNTGTTLTLGDLWSDTRGDVTFTFLGQESAYTDKFFLTIPPRQKLLERGTPGVTSVTATTDPGYVSFKFEGNNGKFAENSLNGSGWDKNTSIGLIGTNMTFGDKTYQFVLGYNDSAGTARAGDWDDFVVGVNFISAIPEPENYAMFLGGLGLLGVMVRRRRDT